MRSLKFSSRLVLMLGAMIVQAASAQTPPITEHSIECPVELPEASISIFNPPLGWVPAIRSKLRLRSAEPMVGPPSEKGFLKPSSSKSNSNGGIDKWTELDGNVEGGKWIACSYGGDNEIILARQIDQKTTECSVEYRREQGNYAIAVKCKW
jgi:hypothetical protein